jgi:hypothetical protein
MFDGICTSNSDLKMVLSIDTNNNLASTIQTFTNVQNETPDASSNFGTLALNPLGGPVGIGLSNPSSSYALEVNGIINCTNVFINGLQQSAFQWTNTSDGNGICYTGGGDVGIGTNNPNFTLDVSGALNCTTLNVSGGAPNFSPWDTDGNDIYYVNNGGYVGIGTANPDYTLDVSGSIASSYDTDTLSYFGRAAIGGSSTYSDFAYFSHIDMASGSGNYALLQSSSGDTFLNAASGKTIYFRINNNNGYSQASYNGTIWNAPSFNATSDLRLKENIKPLENSLNKICSLEGVEFNFKNNKNNKMIGFIAQDVEKIVPEVVNTANDEDKYKSLAYGNVTALLVEAIKELRQEVKELRDELQSYKNNNT